MACLDWILLESGFVILWRELRIARVLLGLGPGLDVCERLSLWMLLLRTKLRELLLLRRRRALSFSLCRLRTCSRLLLPGLLCWRQGGGCSSFGARLWRLLHSGIRTDRTATSAHATQRRRFSTYKVGRARRRAWQLRRRRQRLRSKVVVVARHGGQRYIFQYSYGVQRKGGSLTGGR